MNKGFAGILIVLAAVGGQVLTAGATQLIPVAGLRELLKSAEVVAVVEILRVDNSATAADGPLILEVKVLALKFGENVYVLIPLWRILAKGFHRSSSQSGFSRRSVWTCS